MKYLSTPRHIRRFHLRGTTMFKKHEVIYTYTLSPNLSQTAEQKQSTHLTPWQYTYENMESTLGLLTAVLSTDYQYLLSFISLQK